MKESDVRNLVRKKILESFSNQIGTKDKPEIFESVSPLSEKSLRSYVRSKLRESDIREYFSESEDKELEEKSKKSKGAKPDYLDLDGDGDTKEPMKKAAREKEKNQK